jgi:glyoxylase-like metal-dependent hydrolase (beta-lactamase superfamily II)
MRGMTSMSRTLVRAILAALLLFVAAGMAPAQGLTKTAELDKRGLTAADFPKVVPLARNVYAYSAVHIQGAITTNSLIVVTPEGVVVVDGQGTVAEVQRMVGEIRKLTDAPIRYVVIGSSHGDHTGGNSAFPAGVTFIAHPVSRAALQRAASQPPRAGAPPTAPVVVPTETVSDTRVLTLGGTEMQILNLGRSHTGGDLVVYLPAEKVLFMSETYMHRMFPSMAGGYPSEWIEALKKAEQMNADVYVPGHGFVDDSQTLKSELPLFRRAIETIVAEGKRLHDAGVPVDQAAMQANLGEFASWSIREMMAPPAFRRVYAELDGQLK